METISRFDKSNLSEIRTIIDKKLAELSEELGYQVKFNIGNISFDQDSFSTYLKANIVPIGVEGSENSIARKEWEKYCDKFFLNKDDFGKKFYFKGEEFKICGIKQYAEKYPIIARSEKTGNELLFRTNITNNLIKEQYYEK